MPTIQPSQDSLFRDRVPEAAAHQLATVLAWITECQLATLERLRECTRTSNRALQRQASICDTAVQHCFGLGVTPRGLMGKDCWRLAEHLQALRCLSQSAGAGEPQRPQLRCSS